MNNFMVYVGANYIIKKKRFHEQFMKKFMENLMENFMVWFGCFLCYIKVENRREDEEDEEDEKTRRR